MSPRKRKAVEAHAESHQQPEPLASVEPPHQTAPETEQPVEVPAHESSGATHTHSAHGHETHAHGTSAHAVAPAPGTEVAGAALHGHAPHERSQAQRATGVARKTWQPDPFPLMTVPLGKGRNAPRMTLLRNNRFQQMAIRFDQKPAEHHRTALHDAGWRWREAEGVWTKQLDRDRRAASQLDAERLFAQLADAIRAELGLVERAGPA